jgi:hypothetical protein
MWGCREKLQKQNAKKQGEILNGKTRKMTTGFHNQNIPLFEFKRNIACRISWCILVRVVRFSSDFVELQFVKA